MTLLLVGLPAAAVAHRGSSRSTLTPQVVGGQIVPPGAAPFMVALLDTSRGESEMSRQFCGGSVVAPTWVLTAAHCVTSGSGGTVSANGLAVLVGEQRLGAGAGETIPVAAVVRHPLFNRAAMTYDAALLQLSQPVSPALLHPIGLVGSGDSQYERPGSDLTVLGWGLTQESGRRSADLQEATVKADGDRRCAKRAVYGSEFKGATMLCAGLAKPARDACQGDSGGPLVATANGSAVQVGIVSWGYGCARARYPGVYTQLSNSSVNAWIVSTVSGVGAASAREGAARDRQCRASGGRQCTGAGSVAA